MKKSIFTLILLTLMGYVSAQTLQFESLGVGLALVEENSGLVDEVFVGEEPHQGVGFVAPTGNRHILCACREEEQGEK